MTKIDLCLEAYREKQPSLKGDIPEAIGLIRMLRYAVIQSEELACQMCSKSLYAAIEDIKVKFRISDEVLNSYDPEKVM